MKTLLLIFLVLIFSVTPVYAQTPTPMPNFGPAPAGLTEIENIFGRVISVIVILGFIAMLILILMAGFKYLTSGGEPKALQAAHHTLMWAILGILLMAVAWILLQLIANFTDINLTLFEVRKLCTVFNTEVCPTPTPAPAP